MGVFFMTTPPAGGDLARQRGDGAVGRMGVFFMSTPPVAGAWPEVSKRVT